MTHLEAAAMAKFDVCDCPVPNFVGFFFGYSCLCIIEPGERKYKKQLGRYTRR